MKYSHLFLFFALFLCSSTFINAQNDALEFNNLLVNEQNLVSAKNLEYVSYSVHSEDFATVEQKRLDVVKQIDKSSKTISKKDAPAEAAKMKEEVLEVLKMYKKVFTLDFVEVNELKQSKQNSYQAMENYFKAQDAAEKKLSKASQRFSKAQERFAKKMDVELKVQEEDAKEVEKFAVINEVYGYTRQIFLIQFKVSKADAEFMDGLSENKSASYLDSKKSKLEDITGEAVKALKSTKSFKGDSKYKNSALDLVKFYEEMAKKNYGDMVKLATLKAKNPKKLSRDEVNDYNDLVNKYNETINTYNQKIQELNSKFNEENSKLLQKYVPKIGVPTGKVQRM
jgi:hypothetical protein